MLNEYINAYPSGVSLSDTQNSILEGSGIDAFHQVKLHLDNVIEVEALEEKLNLLSQQHISLTSIYKSVEGYKGARSIPIALEKVVIDRLAWQDTSEPNFDSVLALLPSNINAQTANNIQVIKVVTSENKFLFLRVSAIVMDMASVICLSQQLVSNDDVEEVLQFPDFVQWRDELINSEEGLQGQAYWQQYAEENLTGSPEIEISDLFVQESNSTMAFETKLINLEPSVLSQIQQTSSEYNVSISTILTGTWWFLLAKLTAQSQFNSLWQYDPKQDDEALADAIGMFENVLPVNIKLDENDSFISWLQKLDAQLSSHQEWAECFDTKLLKGLDITTAAGFIYAPENNRFKLLDTKDVSMAKISQRCYQLGNEFKLSLSYQKSNVNLAVVEQLMSQYLYLLSMGAHYLNKSVKAISLVSNTEKETLFKLDNSEVESAIETIFDRLAYYKSTQADSVAIKCNEKQYSYKALATKVNNYASQLINLGVKDGDTLAICLPKSCELVIAMLSVMRAGGAYIPLDPQWPIERINQIANQAKPAFIIAEQDHLVADIAHLNLQTLAEQAPQAKVLPNIKLSNTAYMIYTSGTTGEPKGVCIGHSQLNQYCYSSSKALSLNENKHFAMTSTIAADLGYTCLFNALYNGASLHIATDEQVNDSEKFQLFLEQNDIDCIKIVPSHYLALIDSDTWRYVPRKIIFGGEAVSSKLIKSIYKKSYEIDIYNHYGPTESTVGVMYHHFDKVSKDEFIPKLTGVFEGSGAVILNEFNELCSVGQLGELHIFGHQLASQYFNHSPEFGFKTGLNFADKIYPTGDLARYHVDGGILLAGRKDDQTKIRGFRVEPNEIAHHINTFSDIEHAVVIGENNTLIAYIVNENKETGLLDSDSKQKYIDKLAHKLPEFMIPTFWLSIKDLPLFGNGKINKSLLPKPEHFSERVITKPANSLETLICDVMKDLLEINDISTTQCFMELGAHSLTVIKFVTRLRKLLKVEVEPIMVFENSNVVKLAKVLNNLGSEPSKLEKLAAIQLKLATLGIEEQQQLRRKLLL